MTKENAVLMLWVKAIVFAIGAGVCFDSGWYATGIAGTALAILSLLGIGALCEAL